VAIGSLSLKVSGASRERVIIICNTRFDQPDTPPQSELQGRVGVYTYDGDTAMDARSLARENANIVLTNPDMLHTSILPSHDFWYVVFLCLSLILLFWGGGKGNCSAANRP
jgi:hypothetical protein